jgi:hypothetical protein
MSMCPYCDNYLSLSKSVCSLCFNKMIYQSDAITQYGLKLFQLKILFSVIDYDEFGKVTAKYHENDLYKLQENLIKTTLKTNKQYKELIKCKKNIDMLKEKQYMNMQKKINIEKLLIILFKKFDSKYMKLYATETYDLILKYYESDFEYTSIAFHICLIIEEKMRNDKSKNDNTFELTNIINNNEEYKMFKNELCDLPCYNSYINGDISLIICLNEFNEFVKCNNHRVRYYKIKNIIQSSFSLNKISIIKKTKIYKKFIKSGDINDIDDFLLQINTIVDNWKSKKQKYNKYK